MRLRSALKAIPGWMILMLTACTKIVDTNAIQCHSDQDCLAFPDTLCDLRDQVCLLRPKESGPLDSGGLDGIGANLDSAPLCTAGNGCFSCPPTSDLEFFRACTDATCVSFDNHTRLTNLASDGSIKPLP